MKKQSQKLEITDTYRFYDIFAVLFISHNEKQVLFYGEIIYLYKNLRKIVIPAH